MYLIYTKLPTPREASRTVCQWTTCAFRGNKFLKIHSRIFVKGQTRTDSRSSSPRTCGL